MLKRENNKLWHWTKKLRNRRRVHRNNYNDYLRTSSDFLFSKRDSCKEGELEGKRFNLLLQPRILERQDSLIEVYEEFKRKLLQLYCNPPLTSHSPQLQPHKARSHHSTCTPLSSTLGQPSCLSKEADLVLIRCSAVRPALWTHFISACPCWRVPRLPSAAFPLKYQAGHAIHTTERFSSKKALQNFHILDNLE